MGMCESAGVGSGSNGAVVPPNHEIRVGRWKIVRGYGRSSSGGARPGRGCPWYKERELV